MSIVLTAEVDEESQYTIKICEKCGRPIRKYDKCDCEIVGWNAIPTSSNPIRNNFRNPIKS